jgi:FkbH-like protein
VNFVHPEVMCLDSVVIGKILQMPEMNPRFITDDSKIRRALYLSDIERKKAEDDFSGPQEGFLASLKMHCTIAPVGEDDLKRAEELTVRTHQLNTTGYTYNYDELDAFRKSGSHKLLIVSLEDKYGTYGKIGLVLIECAERAWTIKLLLMSCRVMSRGVGTIIINHIINCARKENVRLLAEFVSNDKNRMMYVTYKFSGFTEIEEKDSFVLFENDFTHIQKFPDYVNVTVK